MSDYKPIDREGFCIAPRKESEIRFIAEQVRKCFHRDDIKYFDIVRCIEHGLPSAYPAFRYEIVEQWEMPDREAEMDPYNFCIRMQERIYRMAIDGDGHCRFTLAHELGHFILHRSQELAFGHPSENGKIPAYRHSEWQADVFARNLLAPLSLAKNMIAEQVEVVFGVSREVANIITGTTTNKKPIYNFNAPTLPGFEFA